MTEVEFYEKIPEWISKDKDGWNHITYLAYFCHKYEKANGLRFRLVKSRKGPTMGKEAGDFAKLFKLFAPDDYSDLSAPNKKKIRKEVNWKVYNYINWIFDYKFRMGHQSVNGTRLFHTPSLIVEFERMYLAHQKKRKDADVMEEFLSWCKNEVPNLLDSHQLNEQKDLKMLEKYAEMYSLGEDSEEIIALNKAHKMGII